MLTNWKRNPSLFPKHNEMMKEFRRLHGNASMVNAPAVKEPSFMARSRPLTATHILIERGGSFLPELTAGWTGLVTVPKIAGYKLSSN